MSVIHEITKLQQMRDNGTLTEEEFTRAKAMLLSPGAHAQGDPFTQQMEWVWLQTEIAQLDITWQAEKETYMVRSARGPCVPNRIAGILQAILFGVLGLVLPAVFGAPRGGAAPAFLIFVVMALVAAGGIKQYVKAGEYEDALTHYERQRAELQARLDAVIRQSASATPLRRTGSTAAG